MSSASMLATLVQQEPLDEAIQQHIERLISEEKVCSAHAEEPT